MANAIPEVYGIANAGPTFSSSRVASPPALVPPGVQPTKHSADCCDDRQDDEDPDEQEKRIPQPFNHRIGLVVHDQPREGSHFVTQRR